AAFFGCLYSGTIAVPAYPPTSRRHVPRLLSIVRDARPAVSLTVGAVLPKISVLTAQAAEMQGMRWLATDALGDSDPTWNPPPSSPGAPAFLQYTSGSTSTPKGV